MLEMRERANRDRLKASAGSRSWLQPTLGGDRRWSAREVVNVPAGLRQRGRIRFDVEVLNLSTFGCGVKSSRPARVGDHSWIMLPTLESWDARLAWSRGNICGLDFTQPLHPAVAEMIVHRANRAPSL